jgi:hypothetical protein
MIKVCLKIHICPIIRYGGSSSKLHGWLDHGIKTSHNGSIIASIMHAMLVKI